MNRLIRLIQNYLIFGLPFVIFFLIVETLHLSGIFDALLRVTPNIVWNLLGFGLMIWFILLFIFLVTVVSVPTIRERTLKRLANLKERDEREHYITGQASRAAYISTLSLMLFLLFLSMFTVNIYKIPNNQTIDGHHHTLSMGFNYSFFEKTKPKTEPQGEVVFDSDNIALSKPTIILILLGWQLLAFNLRARKNEMEDIT